MSVYGTGSQVYFLGIETTCDETAASVFDDRPAVLSSVVASQTNLHARFGGVVPEIASRAHLRQLLPVIDESLRRAGVTLADLEAVAVAHTPGLVGAILVGLTAAKALAYSLGIPLLGVNHLEGHIYACQMSRGANVFPCIGLIVSGGHSNLFRCDSPTAFTCVGATIDDAAGEAFDKVAHLLGLGYPGGPAIQSAAEQGNPNAYAFPRTFLHEDNLDFSFSGLKTAVRYALFGQDSRAPTRKLGAQEVCDVAASFQQAVCDVLVAKAAEACAKFGMKTLCVGGGVAANRQLRRQLAAMAASEKLDLVIAPLEWCTDNAAMAAVAVEKFRLGVVDSLDLDAQAGLVRIRR